MTCRHHHRLLEMVVGRVLEQQELLPWEQPVELAAVAAVAARQPVCMQLG
jgi:hypothetical protein